jgi:hypothetical protein
MHRTASAVDSPVFEDLLCRFWDQGPFFIPGFLDEASRRRFAESGITGAFRRSVELLARTEIIGPGGRQGVAEFAGGGPMDIAVVDALRSGQSVLCRRFDHDHDGTAEMARALQNRLGHPVFATLFITHSEKSTFPAHYDSADVFVLQLFGSKRWELFHRAEPPPSSDEDVEKVAACGPASNVFDVCPGDLLYVPRGLVHLVSPTAAPAVHITFGVKVITVGDLVMALVRSRAGTSELRTALPISRDAEWAGARLMPLLADFLRDASDVSNYHEVMGMLKLEPEEFDWTRPALTQLEKR